jgi:REP element-mobilizing transposase RayT
MRTARQLALPLGATGARRFRTAHGGKAHRARPRHCHRHPVHVTLRRARCLPGLRTPVVFSALRRAFTAASRRWFRVVHFGVQDDHLHLLVETDDNVSLSRGMIGLTVRLARAFNRAMARRGSVWEERFHARALRTPREVRHCLVYVLMNRKKHAPWSAAAAKLDPCSSARWFTGWKHPPALGPPRSHNVAPVVPPRTWLLCTGWKRHGLIATDETPKLPTASGSRTPPAGDQKTTSISTIRPTSLSAMASSTATTRHPAWESSPMG